VDKIVISQQSLGKFIEEVQPGAYASMTKIDFKALDKAHVRPVGVYGSQSQIVDFLEQLNVVDDVTCVLSGCPTYNGLTHPSGRKLSVSRRTRNQRRQLIFAPACIFCTVQARPILQTIQ
jgi:hypothetical protein